MRVIARSSDASEFSAGFHMSKLESALGPREEQPEDVRTHDAAGQRFPPCDPRQYRIVEMRLFTNAHLRRPGVRRDRRVKGRVASHCGPPLENSACLATQRIP